MNAVALALLASLGADPAEGARGNPALGLATPVGLVLELHSDFGFVPLLELEFPNDHRVAMHMNDGVGISAGLSFFPLARGRLATRATVGIKVDRMRAENASALFTAFPVDLVEAVYVGPLRLGAGVSVLVAPRLTGKDLLERSGVEYGPAPGAILEAEWLVSRRTRTGIGLRASWYRFSSPGEVRGAPSVGLVVRADLGLR